MLRCSLDTSKAYHRAMRPPFAAILKRACQPQAAGRWDEGPACFRRAGGGLCRRTCALALSAVGGLATLAFAPERAPKPELSPNG